MALNEYESLLASLSLKEESFSAPQAHGMLQGSESQ
jgi:hypothetical protein